MTNEETLNQIDKAIKSFSEIYDIVNGKKFIHNDDEIIEKNQNLATEAIGILNTTLDKYTKRVKEFGPKNKKVDIFREGLTVNSQFGCGILKDVISELKMLKSKLSHQNFDENQTIEDLKNQKILNSKVFIVHGHDNTIQQAVARVIEKLGLTPIILHEQPNNGKTIIEKFEKHSDVGFAIVLMTDDDEGKEKVQFNLNKRARQNVVLELGYFIGKLGRERVLPLYSEGVELPSDIHGLLYIPIDKNETWRNAIIKELKAAGYNIDANKIF
jgi:predicted nucleotide-binding protein